MTLIALLVIGAVIIAAIAERRHEPSGPSAGQSINEHVYNEAVREARLRRRQRW